MVQNLSTFIKDTNHDLQLFNDFAFPADTTNKLLFITSLYTNIPNHDGLSAVKHYLHKSPLELHIPTILRLTELVLTLNSFRFGDYHFKQTSGVAMGTRMGPSYACLFVESQILSSYTGPVPDFFRRFIDDCFGISTLPKAQLLEFTNYVNDFHPALKFTHEISETSIPFLDIKVNIENNSDHLSTSVHYKPTDSHSYLLYSSSHPSTTRDSIPYNSSVFEDYAAANQTSNSRPLR